MMFSAYKLNKHSDNIQPWCTPFPIWNQSVVPCPVLTVASWPVYRFLKRKIRWSGIPISLRIFQSFLWSTLKDFGIVNKSEVDVFLGLSCFFDDPTGNPPISRSRILLGHCFISCVLVCMRPCVHHPGVEFLFPHIPWNSCDWTLLSFKQDSLGAPLPIATSQARCMGLRNFAIMREILWYNYFPICESATQWVQDLILSQLRF